MSQGMGIADKAEAALRMVREARELVYDTETSGLDWRRNFPIGYVVGSDAQNVVYVPVRHGGGGNLPDKNVNPPQDATEKMVQHRFEVELAKAFEERNQKNLGPTIGHNIKFDAHFSANGGILLGRNLIDTQINEALLNEYTKSFSLENVAKAHKVTAKKGDELYRRIAEQFGCPADRKSMSYYWQMNGSDQTVVDYAEGDGVTTLELFHRQREQIDREGLFDVFDLESQLIWTLFRVERYGMKVNTEYLEELRDRINERVKQAQGELPKGFNVRSPKDMREYIEGLGHTDWPTTEKGNPSFTEKWLKGFPEGENIVTVRKWSNLSNSFVTPLLEEHVFNGRVYANLNQLKSDDYGTISGRLSCSYPNLQQIPKRDKELAALFRKAFVADDGMILWEGDYSQCEPRLFGHYSAEQAIVDGYNADPPKDMHAVVAEMLQVERDPTAKRMNMGILTGMYPKAFAGHMGWSVEEATQKWNQWFQAFPSIKDFQEKASLVFKKRGYVVTLLGRKCRLENPRFAYRAVSRIIQGGNADIVKQKMLEVDRMFEQDGDKSRLQMSVHDSLVWQTPDDKQGQEMAKEVVRVMEDVQGPPFNLRIPFKVDCDWGRNWSEATFGRGD